MSKESAGNQVIQRIEFLEETSRHNYCLMEQKKKECQLLQDENKQLRKQLETAERKLSRLEKPSYLVAV